MNMRAACVIVAAHPRPWDIAERAGAKAARRLARRANRVALGVGITPPHVLG
jgi:hypothetical protein